MQQNDYGWLTLDEIKQAAVMDRLAKLNNNQTKTAESLKITRPTLAQLIKDYQERTEAEQKRIKANQAQLIADEKRNSDAFEFDMASGMSTPKAPSPIPPVELFKPRPMVEQGAIETAMNNAEGSVDRKNLFIPNPKPTPVVKVSDPVMDAAKLEHERFAKLDKTPYSVKHNTQAREQSERESMAGKALKNVASKIFDQPLKEKTTPATKNKKDKTKQVS